MPAARCKGGRRSLRKCRSFPETARFVSGRHKTMPGNGEHKYPNQCVIRRLSAHIEHMASPHKRKRLRSPAASRTKTSERKAASRTMPFFRSQTTRPASRTEKPWRTPHPRPLTHSVRKKISSVESAPQHDSRKGRRHIACPHALFDNPEHRSERPPAGQKPHAEWGGVLAEDTRGADPTFP